MTLCVRLSEEAQDTRAVSLSEVGHVFLEVRDRPAMTDELEFSTRPFVGNVSGCPRRSDEVNRSASFTKDGHTNRHA